MKTIRAWCWFIFSIVIIWVTGAGAVLADASHSKIEPTTNNGERWRIGYYEGGEYSPYQQEFVATVQALMQRGWIERKEIPPQQGEQTRDLWRWLATEVRSDYIDFVQNAHYSSGWSDSQREHTAAVLMDRLTQKKDLDLLIAMGTWAGQDVANNRHSIPTVVMSSSDPVAAGIIESIENSGYEHVLATVDPTLHERQIQVFHEIVDFKRLGVAYEKTLSGRSYAAMDVVERLGKERGFEIVPCYTKSDIQNTALAEVSVIDCFKKLVDRVDALYVTTQGGVTLRSIPELVRLANNAMVPTFSQLGAEEVEHGFLLSLSRSEYKYVGNFHAMNLARIFYGTKPGALEQRYEEPPKIAINLETAKRIEFNTPLVLLGAADEVFREIKKSN